MEQQSRKTRITSSTVRSLRPSEGAQVIRDTMLKGFQIRILPSGNAVYWAEARFGGGKGRNMKYKVGQVDEVGLAEARERARVALDKIRRGIDPQQEKKMKAHEGKTLRQLIEDFYSVKTLKPSTKTLYGYHTKEFKDWMDKRAVDITDYEISDWYVRGKHKPDQTDGAFRFLRTLMKFAVGRRIIKENPCQMVTNTGMRYKKKHRTGHIENNNLGKFFKSFVEYKYVKDSEIVARDALLLIVTTGLRSAEARTLRWENVDFKRGKFVIPDTKNGLDHTVPMTPLTWSLLKYRERQGEGSEYVFRIKKSSKTKSGHVTNIQKTLANICKQAGIQVVCVHDLRRTFATVLNSIDVGFLDLKKLMNHKTKDISAHYTQPDIDKLRKILMRVVDYYDKSFPSMAADSGFTMYNGGALNHKIYGQGELNIRLLSQMESESQAMQVDDEPEYPWGN